MVSLANNHTLDHGRASRQTLSFSALDGAGILYGGAGDSCSAKRSRLWK
ncbi:MAG: hypothetical protein ACLVCH_12740 [Roseburia inulinivorans]